MLASSQPRTSLSQRAHRALRTADRTVQLVGRTVGRMEALWETLQTDSQQVARDTAQLSQVLSQRLQYSQQTLRATPRFFRAAVALAKVAARYRAEESRAQSRGQCPQYEAIHEWGAQVAYNTCLESRGALLKLGQFLSMRPDLVPNAYIRSLANLRDKVPAVAFAVIKQCVEEELGAPLLDVFASFSQKPAAAASFAQVHRAELKDGRQVAVKVRIPGVREEAMADLSLLRTLVGNRPKAGLPFDPIIVLRQFEGAILKELDYRTEKRHANEFFELLANHPGVASPRVDEYPGTESLLIMEWKEGLPLSEALTARSADKQRALLTNLVASTCRQMLVHGSFHADLHSGNILVTDDDELVLLDFGCVAHLSEENRRGYLGLLQAMMTRQRPLLLQSLHELGFEGAPGSTDAIAELAEQVLDMLCRREALSEWALDPQAVCQEVLGAAQKVPGLRIPDHFVLVARVLGTLGGLLVEFADAGIDLPAAIAHVLRADLVTPGLA